MTDDTKSNMEEEKHKIVFFDMEGTLFRPWGFHADGSPSVSAWGLLARAMGPEVDAAENENYKKWQRGEYETYIPWMEDTSRVFKNAGMTKNFFHEVIHSMNYFPGVKETIGTLHDRGIRTGVITGGFHEHAGRAVEELGLHHAFASSRFFWDEQGALSHWEFEEYGLEGKVVAARQIAEHYGLSLQDCAFVGDGSNDVHIASSVGTSIAFNGEKALQDVATYAINQEKGNEDFRAILEYLL